MWWLGQSGFYVNLNPLLILFDPYLSDSLTRKYAATEKPHVRMTRRVVAPERLSGVDVVTSTHAHTDHLDGETLGAVFAASRNATFIYPRATQATVDERLAVRPRWRAPMKGGETRGIPGGACVTAIPSAHPQIETDGGGHHKYLGYVVKYRGFTLYHSGDTVVYEGLADQLRPHNVDVAILPINGKVGNMGGRDAARLAHDIGARVVVPCHYEMFEFNTADPRDEFVPECERLGQPYKVLRAGERLTLAPAGSGAER
jgi:L-ascorbate metabolism protein UlaG (beta-lactamase superfamily)